MARLALDVTERTGSRISYFHPGVDISQHLRHVEFEDECNE
jgi:hypothetical protein